MDDVLVLCRLLQFASAMLLFGVSVFQAFVAPASIAPALNPASRQACKVAALVVLATAIGWLLLTAGEMGDGWDDACNPSVVGAVIFDTDFGRVWLWRLGTIGVLLAVLILTRDDRWAAVATLTAIILGSLGLVGHAVMQSGMLDWLTRLSFVAHVLAAGFWLGSLAPLIASLRLEAGQACAAIKLTTLKRFSGFGEAAVATVLVTGAANTWLVLGAPPLDVSSPYQALLLAKIALVALMLALALVNRLALMPRLRDSPDSLRKLRWSAAVEIGAGLGAVALVSAIGTLPPV